MNTGLFVVGNRNFDFGAFRKIFGQRVDLTRSEFDVLRICRRTAFDDSQVDPSLILRHCSINLRDRNWQRCVCRKDVVWDTRLRLRIADQDPQRTGCGALLFELSQARGSRGIQDRLRKRAVGQQHPCVIGCPVRDRLIR